MSTTDRFFWPVKVAAPLVAVAGLYVLIQWLSVNYPDPVVLFCFRLYLVLLCFLSAVTYAMKSLTASVVEMMSSIDREAREANKASARELVSPSSTREQTLEAVVQSLANAGYDVHVESELEAGQGLECRPEVEDLTAALDLGDGRNLR
jgi:cobalamin biosynthesis protein CobD/CbiB